MMITRRRRGVIGVMVVSLLSGLAFASTSARATATTPAAKLDSLSFSTLQALTSTTHKHLRLVVSVSRSAQQTPASTSGFVVVTRKGAPEVHDWSFPRFTNSSFAYNVSTGQGAVRLASQIEPFGRVAVTLNATGKKRVSTCGTYQSVIQPVTVRGVLTFDTRSTGKLRWGRVGSAQARILRGTSSVSYQTGTFRSCGQPLTHACLAAVNWDAFKQSVTNDVDEVSFAGSMTKSTSTLFAERNVALKKPQGAVRSDSLQITNRHMKFSLAAAKATVTVGPAGPVTGAAKLVAPKPGSSFPGQCGPASHQRTLTSTSWVTSYTNGKTPLTVHQQIEGSYRLSNLRADPTELHASINQDVVS